MDPDPDFADLFPRPTNPDEFWLEPRTASMLHLGLGMLGDELTDDLKTFKRNSATAFEDALWLHRLPRFTWGQNKLWFEGLARSAFALMADLENGDIPYPRSLAEEIVLHFGIEVADGILGDENLMAKDAAYQALPPAEEVFEPDSLEFMLFQDTDFLLIFSLRFDGIELAAQNFRPEAWFDWFANAEPRNQRPGLLSQTELNMDE